MSDISTKLTYLNTTKGKIKDAINLTNANILSEDTFRSYAEKLKLGLIDIINNGTDDLYDSFPKTTGTGTEIALNDTYEAPMEIGLNGNTHQGRLPSEYTQVDYIESSGTQFIDTGVFPNDNIQIETNIEVTSTDQDTSVFGCYVSSLDNSLGRYYHLTPYNSKWYYGGDGQEENGGEYSPVVGTKYNIIFNNQDGNIVINDNTITVNTPLTGYPDSTLTISRRGGTNSRYGKFKYYSFKIYDKNTQNYLRNFIPCYRNSDNVVGMYDLVNDVFYTNQGTGTFTYGSIAPTPESPIDIEVVTGDNTINVTGKNLAKVSSGNNAILTDTIQAGTYTFSLDFYYSVGYSLKANDGNGETIVSRYPNNSGRDIVTFTINTPMKIFINGYSRTTGKTFAESVNNYQLEQGSATPYQPYQSKDYEISLGNIELCKIPNTNYQDIIFHAINGDSFYDTLDNATKQTLTYGKWYKHSEIGKVVLDGSENWTKGTSSFYSGVIQTTNKKVGNDVISIISNYFKGVNFNSLVASSNQIASGNNDGVVRITYYYSQTIEELKAWLSTNTPLVYYVLETPTNTEITDTELKEDLEELEKAKSVDDKTFISQINEQLPFILDVSALSKN